MLNLLKHSIDLFLPRFCINCDTKLSDKENWLCVKCFSGMELTDKEEVTKFYLEKFNINSEICSLFSCFKYQKTSAFQKLIHKLKYSGYFRIGIYLGNLIGENIKLQNLFCNFDLLIPVPIHKIKKIERGYNQSEYITKGISHIIHIPYKNNVIVRKTYKDSQTKHTQLERLKNIHGVFEIKKPNFIKDKNIIIVDDIVTTGATVSEIAKTCKDAGANKISVVTAGLTILNC